MVTTCCTQPALALNKRDNLPITLNFVMQKQCVFWDVVIIYINFRYTWDRLQNKCTNCKGVKNNTNFGQITGIQEKLDTTCK